MRIGIDVSSIVPRRTGIGTYTCELVRRLTAATEHQFVLLFNSLRQPAPTLREFQTDNVTVQHYRIPGPLLLKSWQYLNSPAIERLTGPVDLFHSPSTYIPPQCRGAKVATVHDLHFRKNPEHAHWLGGKYLEWVCRHRLSQMDAVIVEASSTAEELHRWLGIDRVHIVPLGVDDRFFGPSSQEQIRDCRERHGLPSEYILHVGTHEPRKNIGGLLRIVRALGSSAPPLVMAGTHGWDSNPEWSDLLRRLVDEGRVHVAGYVPQEELPGLYRGALLFVLPSWSEGFGLPVLEAMASEVPVVCSGNVAVLEFIGSGSVRVIDPAAPDSAADAIRELLNSPSALDRLKKEGRQSAERLTWDTCAQATLKIFTALV